jgi:hypothetical protein
VIVNTNAAPGKIFFPPSHSRRCSWAKLAVNGKYNPKPTTGRSHISGADCIYPDLQKYDDKLSASSLCIQQAYQDLVRSPAIDIYNVSGLIWALKHRVTHHSAAKDFERWITAAFAESRDSDRFNGPENGEQFNTYTHCRHFEAGGN